MIDKQQLIVFDLETTGTNTETDRIVEIAICKLDMERKNWDSMTTLINPEMNIPKEATEIHHITNEMVKDSPKFREVAATIVDYMKGCAIAGYNSNRFDVPMLIAEMGRCGISWPDPTGTFVDILELERIVNSHKLAHTYKRYTGMDMEDAHEALADVKATITVFVNQIDKLKEMGLISSSSEYTYEELDKITQADTKRLDFARKLVLINDTVCWAFGKHQYKPITCDVSYATWVLGTNFPSDTKAIIKKELGL